MASEYPENWKELSKQLCLASNGKCKRCRRKLLKPGERARNLRDSYRRRMNPHHKDRNKANCDPKNIEILCPRCHLIRHRPERRGARYDNGQLDLFQNLSKF